MPNVNQLDVVDVRNILNSLHTQATGQQTLAPTNTGEFVSMATTTLAVGTDIVHNALMTTIAKTIFSARPYDMKFRGLVADDTRWGGIVRKITHADNDISEDDKVYHNIVDGKRNADMYKVKKGDVLEMRFYGSDVYQDYFTTFEDQLYTAFQSEAQLGSFIASKTTEMNNKWTQYMEELARGSLANFIGAKVSLDNGVVHLLTEYNAFTGRTGTDVLSATDIYKPENVKPFFEWVKARINTLSRRMTERSELFQYKITGKKIMRHTPYANQKIYLSADALDIIDATVLSEAYHNSGLKYADVEGVSYWQAIDTPNKISVAPSVVNETGAASVGENVEVDNIFGVMFDEDAIAINPIRRSVGVTPMEQEGRYWNTWLSANTRYTNDLTEKGIILLLD